METRAQVGYLAVPIIHEHGANKAVFGAEAFSEAHDESGCLYGQMCLMEFTDFVNLLYGERRTSLPIK